MGKILTPDGFRPHRKFAELAEVDCYEPSPIPFRRQVQVRFDKNFMGQTGEFDLPMRGGLAPTDWTPIAIEVSDLEQIIESLVATGIQLLNLPSDKIPLGRKYAFLRDPDGRIVTPLGPRSA